MTADETLDIRQQARFRLSSREDGAAETEVAMRARQNMRTPPRGAGVAVNR
jgi:hypothetical protein